MSFLDEIGLAHLWDNIKNYIDEKIGNKSDSESGVINWEDINGRPDLSNVSKLDVVQITIPSYLWSDDGEAIVPVEKILEDVSLQLITPVPTTDSYNLYYESDIKLITQAEGSLTFKAETIPEDDVDVYIYIQSVSELSEEYVGEFVWWSPQMTSNNTPAPYVATASTSHFPAYFAFNGKPATSDNCWHSTQGDSNPWIAIDFGTKRIVSAMALEARTFSGTPKVFPSKGTIQGSQDGLNWIDIISFNGLPRLDNGTTTEIDFDSVVSFRHYRIANMNNGYTGFGDIKFKVLEGSV